MESDIGSTRARLFDRLVVDSPSTSTSKTTTPDTQSLINQTILQQLTAIGERLDKIEQKTLRKHQGPINPKVEVLGPKTSRSCDNLTGNHSARIHTNVTDTHTVPSTVSLLTLGHLKANYNIQKVVAERLSELQHLRYVTKNQISTWRAG